MAEGQSNAASAHAETIRAGVLAGDDMPDGSMVTDALAALAALLTENEQLREALEVATICMCDSCRDSSLALLESLDSAPRVSPDERSASAASRCAVGSDSSEVGAE